jgi:hypothetical protein
MALNGAGGAAMAHRFRVRLGPVFGQKKKKKKKKIGRRGSAAPPRSIESWPTLAQPVGGAPPIYRIR